MKNQIFKILFKLLLLFAENISVNKHASNGNNGNQPLSDGSSDDKGETVSRDLATSLLGGLPSVAPTSDDCCVAVRRKSETDAGRWTAVTMLISGIMLAFLSFFIGSHDVPDGVLWYVAQALIYAGGIFGVTIYFRSLLVGMKNRKSADGDAERK